MAAFAIRLAWLAAPHALQPDSLEYIRLARSIVSAGTYSADGVTPSTYRPPLYPFLLAAAQVVTTHWLAAVLVLQCILGAITVGLIMALGRRLIDARVALVAGVLLACAPMTGYFASLLLTETLFTFLVVVGMFLWTDKRPLAAGLALGAGVLTRASLLPYILLLGLAGFLPPWSGRRASRQIAAAALIVIAPWAARNAVSAGRLTVADAGWGTNLLIGTIDLQTGANRWVQINAARSADAGSAAPGSSAAEAAAAARAVRAIRADPAGWALVRVRQWIWLFVDAGDYLPVTANGVSFRQALRARRADTVLLKAGFAAGTVLLALLAVCGAWLVRGRAVELLPLWSFPAYLAAAHAPMFVEPRYGLPLVPFLTLFGAVALVFWSASASAAVNSQPGADPGGFARRAPA